MIKFDYNQNSNIANSSNFDNNQLQIMQNLPLAAAVHNARTLPLPLTACRLPLAACCVVFQFAALCRAVLQFASCRCAAKQFDNFAVCRLPLAACRLPLATCRLPLAACRLPLAALRCSLLLYAELQFAACHCAEMQFANLAACRLPPRLIASFLSPLLRCRLPLTTCRRCRKVCRFCRTTNILAIILQAATVSATTIASSTTSTVTITLTSYVMASYKQLRIACIGEKPRLATMRQQLQQQ